MYCSKMLNVTRTIKRCTPYIKCKKTDITTWLEKEKLTGLKIIRWSARGGGCDVGVDCDSITIRVLVLPPGCAYPLRYVNWRLDPSDYDQIPGRRIGIPKPSQGGGVVDFTPRY